MAKGNVRPRELESKFIRELRKENKRLKAENRLLRKENRRFREETESEPFADEEENTEYVYVPLHSDEARFSCPKCGAYTRNIFQVANRLFFKCEGCGGKGPVSHD